MADSYLIDGYNLLHALGMIQHKVGPGGLEAARTRLLDFLATAFDDKAQRVTVVFDARHAPRGAAREQTYRGLQVQFAPSKKSADDAIEDAIEEAVAPKSLVVVSNDTRLQNAARRRGARFWSHHDLLDSFDQQNSNVKANVVEDEKGDGPMSPDEAKRWLKEFESIEEDDDLKEFFDLDRFD
jgi:predicted RNA-binding protein with PIN domain